MGVREILYSVKFVDVLLLGILFVCSYTDIKERKILNIVIFPSVIIALVIHLFQQGIEGLLFWGLGTLVGVLLLFIPFLVEGIGAGDVKLLGMIGSFKGVAFVFKAFLCAALLGGVLSFLFLLQKKRLRKTLSNLGQALKVLFFSCFRIFNVGNLGIDDIVAIPYGLAISLGAMVCLVGDWLW